MENNYNQKYVEFASNIHFYEFLQDEFKEPHFKLKEYLLEINKLDGKTNWDIDTLSNFLKTHPKSFDLFQEIFQLTRFTNTQLTHFLFDVTLLNNTNKNILKKYLIQNLEEDKYFYKLYITELKKTKIEIDSNNLVKAINDNEVLFDSFIWIFKSVVSKYVLDSVAKVEILHNRLSKDVFKDISERTAKYLINNLKLNNILKGIDIKEFLLNKRIGIDTKSIHGKFGNIKIKNILEKHKLINVDNIFNELGIKKLPRKLTNPQLEKYANKIVYVTEKYLEGISKRKDNKLKKFDFIIIHDLKPKILIETNFYSTSGTKIGINQGEYVDLKQDIEKLSNNYLFLWITDGNYWLTSDGHSRLLHLYTYFGDQILNYNLFDKKLLELIEKLQ
jgi:hypothetical protein